MCNIKENLETLLKHFRNGKLDKFLNLFDSSIDISNIHEFCDFMTSQQTFLHMICDLDGSFPEYKECSAQLARDILTRVKNTSKNSLFKFVNRRELKGNEYTGRTPLEIACLRENQYLIDLLIGHGADATYASQVGKPDVPHATEMETRLTELVMYTSLTCVLIEYLQFYLDCEFIHDLKYSDLTRYKKTMRFWEWVIFHDEVSIDTLKLCFRRAFMSGVVIILDKIDYALGRAYNLGIPLVVPIIRNPANPYELVTKNRVWNAYNGIALLLNIINFNDSSKTRNGAEQDSKYLHHLFGQLNLNVLSFSNSNECFTQKDVAKIVGRDVPEIIGNRAPPCLIGFIGSHMGHGKVLLSDGNRLDLHKDILQPIHDIPCLEGVPKIFIIEGCRQNEVIEESPKYTNTIVCYSARPGETSLRDPDLGSLYIRIFTEVMMREVYRANLKEKLEKVRYYAIHYQVHCKEINGCQVPDYQSDMFDFSNPNILRLNCKSRNLKNN